MKPSPGEVWRHIETGNLLIVGPKYDGAAQWKWTRVLMADGSVPPEVIEAIMAGAMPRELRREWRIEGAREAIDHALRPEDVAWDVDYAEPWVDARWPEDAP